MAPYFVKKSGEKILFRDVANAVKILQPAYRNKHVFEQLNAIGLYEEFQEGETPFGLPYSFTAYED